MSDKYISSEDIKKAKKHFIDKISKAKKVGEILEAKEEYQEFVFDKEHQDSKSRNAFFCWRERDKETGYDKGICEVL
jgi:hypothetical protein